MKFRQLMFGALLLSVSGQAAQAATVARRAAPGAAVTWTTYQAEAMHTDGKTLGPHYQTDSIEAASSQQMCVRLGAGQFVEFIARARANALVVRYSLPDSPDGEGTDDNLDLFRNGKFVRKIPVTSRFAWLYGRYPFDNDPKSGAARDFYDEARVKDVVIAKGDKLRLQKSLDGNSACTIDLVDLEEAPPPLSPPANSLSIAAFGANGKGEGDDSSAFHKCVSEAVKQHKSVFLPAGNYLISDDIVLPTGLVIQGAGMWHTNLLGNESRYGDPGSRVRLVGHGSNIHLADFAIIGKLKYRDDGESNDGITGSFGTGSSISRIWIEHTKCGLWVSNSSGLRVDNCRVRNTQADGFNFNIGMRSSTIKNCTTRGTGDDGFAIWPATYLAQVYSPGFNVIRRCTAELPFVGNGAAIYGGQNNCIEECVLRDVLSGSAILLSTTFPTANAAKGVDNNFQGTTVVRDCDLVRSGGAPLFGAYNSALQICLDRRSIAGLELSNLLICDSIADGIGIIAPGAEANQSSLSDTLMAQVDVKNCGIGVKDRNGLWIRADARGKLKITRSNIPTCRNDSSSFQIVCK